MNDFNDILRMHMSGLQDAYANRRGQQYGDPALRYAPSYAETLQPYPGMGGGREGMMRAQQRQSMFDAAPPTSNAYGFRPQMNDAMRANQPLYAGSGGLVDQNAEGIVPGSGVPTPPAMPQPAAAGFSTPAAPASVVPSGGVPRRKFNNVAF